MLKINNKDLFLKIIKKNAIEKGKLRVNKKKITSDYKIKLINK